jgi:hypothetical protein
MIRANDSEQREAGHGEWRAARDPLVTGLFPAGVLTTCSPLTTGFVLEAAEAFRSILLQRLHMRNEQFGFPVKDDRIRAIEAGEIEPMKLDGIALKGLTD